MGLFAAVMLASCASNETADSDDVKQSEIHQAYTITYNAAEKELKATASFRFGGPNGTTLHLVEPSKITLDGEEMGMDKNIFSGTFYEADIQTGLKSSYTFVFTDCENKKYMNVAEIFPVEVDACPDEIITARGFEVTWKSPLREGETMDLIIEDNTGHSATVSTNIVGAATLSFDSGDLGTITSGPGHVYLVRRSDKALAEATHLGGSMSIKYLSHKKPVKIKGGQSADDHNSPSGEEQSVVNAVE